MTLRLLLLSLSASVLWTASAQTSIPIFNPGFEQDMLSCAPGYNCGYQGISGWIAGPSASTYKPGLAEFPRGVPEGTNVAALGNSSVTGSIMQTLGATVQANTTYVLKMSVGARADMPFTGYYASLMAGNVVLAIGDRATPVGGTFVTEAVVYVSGPAPLELGVPLQIFIKSLGTGQVEIDEISLTAE